MMMTDLEKEMLSKALKEIHSKDFEELKKTNNLNEELEDLGDKLEEFKQNLRNDKKLKRGGRRYCIEKMNLREYSKKQLIRIIRDLQNENDELLELLEDKE